MNALMEGLEEIAAEVIATLGTLRAGTVLALWGDGSFSVEPFAVWSRRGADGSLELPLATFVPGGEGPSPDEVLAKLQRAVERLGL